MTSKFQESASASNPVEWETPPELFKAFDDVFHFDLDVCATEANAKCAWYHTTEKNALQRYWHGKRCWMNPPYGREIRKWVEKAVEESKHCLVVALLPARTDTKWWQEVVAPNAACIWWLKGRVTFVGAPAGAKFPSVVVLFASVDVRCVKG